ncbi:MAG TPA: class I SAM-dependent methyltransferase [Kofleriaceae bacterium]|nr:class I SAM-dependent methyltransferase [Kofleriaceae bacterium]
MLGPVASWLDRVLYRHAFEGASARRYADDERPAFGDFDDRLLDALAPLLSGATPPGEDPHSVVRLLDVGAGPGAFAMRAAERFAELSVLAIEPSRDFAHALGSVAVARARGEALPLPDASIDVAICLSSIRHVQDRGAVFRELRRVVRRERGRLVIVELDPAASSSRIAAHADRLGSRVLRHAFGPLVVRTAPTLAAISALAVREGWSVASRRDDPVQPVYILELA